MINSIFIVLTAFSVAAALQLNDNRIQYQHRFLQSGISNKLHSLSSSSSLFSFPNPLLKQTTDSDVKILKQDNNIPPAETDGGGDVYVGAPRDRFLEKKLRNDAALIPCSECMKLVDRYVGSCSLDEAALKPLRTIREFCDQSLGVDPTFNEQDVQYCQSLGHKLAVITGSNYAALNTNNHVMGTCAAYEQLCKTYGGAPNCYSGFCDDVVECTDCPFAVLQINEQAPMQAEVCGDRGVCRLASLKSRSGYCECDDGYKGLACDAFRS